MWRTATSPGWLGGEEEAERIAETTSVGFFSLKQWPDVDLENL
jgi:hypothetical protein